MATQQDLQDLLRLLTQARKLPMLQAMSQVKALQVVDLRSIQQISEASLEDVGRAIPDAKAARSLHSACKAAVKRGGAAAPTAGGKRPPGGALDPASKRAKVGGSTGADGLYGGGGGGPSQTITPRELEASLALPMDADEGRISARSLLTNRAPLVLAFAVELLRYTMPEQPPSSRLSLAQAVVAANSRSKAVSLGIERGLSAEQEGWGEGQPRVRVMGREIFVLKRGGYEWEGEEEVDRDQVDGGKTSDTQDDAESQSQSQTQHSSRTELAASAPVLQTTAATASAPPQLLTWSTSQSISLKSSTFVARATHITDPSQRKKLVSSLMERYPKLKTATHNAWAYRVRIAGSGRVAEESFDDGETGCGDLMLRMMRESDAVDSLVVLTRWFGGIMLGPDRWRLMRNCVRGALAERMRLGGTEVDLGGEAVWGLDLEAMRAKSNAGAAFGAGAGGKQQETTAAAPGMQIHRPEAARNYLLKSFATAAAPEGEEGVYAPEKADPPLKSRKAAAGPKKKTLKAVDAEKEENLGLLLGALRLVFDSWADHLTAADLDRRAWSWYMAVRPEVDPGPSGWGAKGPLRLAKILDLRRKG